MTHKQTFNRQACAIKKEAPLLLFELSISLSTRTVNRFHGRIPWQRFSKIMRTRRQWQPSSIGVSIGKLKTAAYSARNRERLPGKILTNFLSDQIKLEWPNGLYKVITWMVG